MWLPYALLIGVCIGLVHGVFPASLTPKLQPIQNTQVKCDNTEPGIGVAYFAQYINHSNPAQGTFRQKYFWRSTHWGGPGYPVVLMTPGEVELAPYCSFSTAQSLATQFAIAVSGAVILIEHRYWGDSSPFSRITADTLSHLTLNNSVEDLVNFARNAPLPFDQDHGSNAPSAPWVLSGGSYAGALTAWTAKLSPGTFWAYHASSAPVQAIYNFWQYFSPIRQGMPQNCSRDLADIIAYVDVFVKKRARNEVEALKASFGLEDLAHADDFASVITNAVDTWQDSSLTSGYTTFFQMCDAIEGHGINILAGYGTTNVRAKTANLAWWFKKKFLPNWCYKRYGYIDWNDTMATGCLNSYNLSSPLYTDRSVSNTANTQWFWMLCNEPLAYWQTGAGPANEPAITSRLLTPAYFQRQCDIYGFSASKTVGSLNKLTDGWSFKGKRILWVNGEFDPWSFASVSSSDRPGGPLNSSKDAPVIMIKDGKHCEDLIVQDSTFLKSVQIKEVNQIVRWVNDFYSSTTSAMNNVLHAKPVGDLHGII